MKRQAIGAILAAMVLAVGCGTDVKLGNRPQFATGTAVLTVLAFDGTTGATLETATMAMHIGPITLTAERVGNAYTFENVPAGSNYPIFVTAAGYLEFVGTAGALAAGTSLASPSYTTSTAFMFPTNSVPGDFTFKVYDSKGVAVTGGYILAALNTADIAKAFDQTMGSQLTGAWGFKPSVIRMDLTAGVAVIPAAQMVFGASYKITVVNAKNAAGLYLKPAAGSTTISPTQDYLQTQIFLGLPTANPVVISASNEAPNDLKAVTSLTVNFAMDIELCNDVGVTDFETVSGALGGIVGTGAAATEPAVTVPPSANATFTGSGTAALTITPAISGLNTTMRQTSTLSNVKVKVKGMPTDATNCLSLFAAPGPALNLRGVGGSPVSGVIYISYP